MDEMTGLENIPFVWTKCRFLHNIVRIIFIYSWNYILFLKAIILYA